MNWTDFLLKLAGLIGAILVIYRFVVAVVKPIQSITSSVKKMEEHDKEQYLSILRLTIMSPDMPVSERIIAGEKYIKDGGNGDVKAYYEDFLKEHTK